MKTYSTLEEIYALQRQEAPQATEVIGGAIISTKSLDGDKVGITIPSTI